jgi:hypothetical protein
MSRKLNKPLAGYHLLMILSAVDNRFHVEEDLVIRDWLVEQFPFATDLDKELAHISSIKPEDFMSNYQDAMNDFYADSDEKERNELISFAMKLAKSDRVITPEENKFLNELFEKWGNGND